MKQPDLEQLLRTNYGLRNPKVSLIKAGVSNTNYLVTADGSKFVFRICNYAVENQTTNAIKFMSKEHALSFKTPRVIPTAKGKPIVVCRNNPTFLMTLAPGKPINVASVTSKQIASLGKSVAELHKLEYSFARASATLTYNNVFNAYHEYVEALVDRTNDSAEIKSYVSLMQRHYEALVGKIPGLSERLPKGVVHNDLTPENILFIGQNVSAIVDWEEVGVGIPLFDVARAINAWFFDGKQFQIKKTKDFISSYQLTREFTQLEKNQLETALIYEAFVHAIFNGKIFSKGAATIEVLSAFNVKVLRALSAGFNTDNIL